MLGLLRGNWASQGQIKSEAGGGAIAARKGDCGSAGLYLCCAGKGCCRTVLCRLNACNPATLVPLLNQVHAHP